MNVYQEYMRSHENYENKLMHFIGFLTIIGTLIYAWHWVWAAILFDLAISWVGHHFFEGNKPAFLASPRYAIPCYVWMNLQFFWFNKVALTLGFGVGFVVGSMLFVRM